MIFEFDFDPCSCTVLLIENPIEMYYKRKVVIGIHISDFNIRTHSVI